MLTLLKNKLITLCSKILPEIDLLVSKIEDNQRILLKMETFIEAEKDKAEKELAIYKEFCKILINNSKHMIWLKDLEGTYIISNNYMNKVILNYTNPYGKTSYDINSTMKENQGDYNFTILDNCDSSDNVIRSSLQSKTFIQKGKINGKVICLEVFKFPFFIDGKLVGIGGIATNVGKKSSTKNKYYNVFN